MITMFDSIDPADLPAGAGYAYAGYVNGRWPDYNAIKRRFPGAHVLSITITAGADADCLDVETGDATVPEAAAWVARRLAAGAVRPCIYASVSQMSAALGAIQAAVPGALSLIRIWTAHYGAGKHICGPGTCRLINTHVDGTQWTDTVNGASLDESLLLDNFFGDTKPPVTPVPDWETAMMNALPTLQLGARDMQLPFMVRRVQGLCLAAMPTLKMGIDGSFGPATQAAVKQVQKAAGIAQDGIVGPQTWAALVTGSA